MRTVLSADIIGSTQLPVSLRRQVTEAAKAAFESLKARPKIKYSIGRGDFIQAELPVKEGLRYLLLLKSYLNRLTESEQDVKQEKVIVDVRISLAIGEVTIEASTVGESDGPAYQLSGRALDEMKSAKQSISLQCTEQDFNEELYVMARSLEFITDKWTKGSAEIVSLLLQGNRETDISEKLGISQSAVNQRKKTAGWDILMAMLQRYEKKSVLLKQA